MSGFYGCIFLSLLLPDLVEEGMTGLWCWRGTGSGIFRGGHLDWMIGRVEGGSVTKVSLLFEGSNDTRERKGRGRGRITAYKALRTGWDNNY